MTKEEKRKCKNDITVAKRWYKRLGRNQGIIAFVQSEYNIISTLEIAIRYLIMKGYHFNLSYGTSKFFRICYISIE